MQASPHLAIVMSRPAFLWEYAIRFRTASDTHKLGPEFVKTEQENLSRWREIQSGNRKTPSLPGLAQGQQKEPAPVGGAPSVRDDVDDAPAHTFKGKGKAINGHGSYNYTEDQNLPW